MSGRAVAVALVCGWVMTGVASAQAPTPAARGRPPYEVSAGVLWTGGYDLGAASASLTAPTSGQLTLFDTDTRLAAAPGVSARLGYWLYDEARAEIGFGFSRPLLTTEVRNDPERGAEFAITDRVSEYVFDLGGAYEPAGIRFSDDRARPFVALSIGHVRHRHQDGILVETGWQVQVGGGLTYLLLTRAHGLLRGIGARADLRVAFRRGGVELEENRRTLPGLGLSIVVGR